MTTDEATLATGANAVTADATAVAADRTRQTEQHSVHPTDTHAKLADTLMLDNTSEYVVADALAPTPTPVPALDSAMDLATSSPEEDENSKKVTLADLCARAATLYAHRNYADASETYAHAAELQAELRGEMDPENAEILFLYGRALFKVGQSESDVLGGKAPAPDAGATKGGQGQVDSDVEIAGKKGLVQFDEDENALSDDVDVDDNDQAAAETEAEAGAKVKAAVEAIAEAAAEAEGDGADANDEEAENEPDDLQQAFQALDLAGVLFRKKLHTLKEPAIQIAEEKDDEQAVAVAVAAAATAATVAAAGTSADDGMTRHIKERLGDTHEFLAEISLENERYPAAIDDCRAALAFKTDLYPPDSEVVAEAHFKLSLALEFASVTTVQEEDSGNNKGSDKPRDSADAAAHFDQGLRDEAARELEAAIECVKLKIANKEVDLATMASPEENDATRAAIAESREILADMEQRLVDLRKPPVDVAAALEAAAPDVLSGLLGTAAKQGESAQQTAARVAEASRNAADLTGLVRKKNADSDATVVSTGGNGKRKAEEDPVDEVASGAAGADSGSKKARVEEAVTEA